MVNAVGPVSTACPAVAAGGGAATPSVALAADLVKARKELSETVSCASSKTPEGKAKIDELSAKVSAIRTRMEKTRQEVRNERDADAAAAAAAAARSKADAPRVGLARHAAGDGDGAARGGASPVAGGAAAILMAARSAPASALGGFVDLYA